MFARPQDLRDDEVAAAFSAGWGLQPDSIEYAAVGFGSYHWRVMAAGLRWFLTADDLGAEPSDARLQTVLTALSTAHALREHGRSFVVAPVPSVAGAVAETINNRYLLAVYPHVEGETGAFGRYESRNERLAVVERLIDLHDASGVSTIATVDDFSIPSRTELFESLSDLDTTWHTGPYGEPCRQLLAANQGPLRQAFVEYDRLVDLVRTQTARFVITHGEPHRGNVIFTVEGPALIDWDTTLLAPAERDLWSLVDEDRHVREVYDAGSGRSLDDDTLRLYQLRWDLTEVALFTADFSQPHQGSADTLTRWQGLQHHLVPSRWQDSHLGA